MPGIEVPSRVVRRKLQAVSARRRANRVQPRSFAKAAKFEAVCALRRIRIPSGICAPLDLGVSMWLVPRLALEILYRNSVSGPVRMGCFSLRFVCLRGGPGPGICLGGDLADSREQGRIAQESGQSAGDAGEWLVCDANGNARLRPDAAVQLPQ